MSVENAFAGVAVKDLESAAKWYRKTRASDLGLFARIAKVPTEGESAVQTADMPIRVLVPAFVISELKIAFQIGFMVFIPFILIDLICASVLMSASRSAWWPG